MKYILIVFMALSILGCGSEDDGNGLSVYTTGLWLESSDGKYIGELAGVPDLEVYIRHRNCVHVYNPDYNIFFSVDLDTAKACNMLWIYFSNSDCTYTDGQVYTAYLPLNSMWRAIDPETGDLYAASEEVTDIEILSGENAGTGICESKSMTSENTKLLVNTGVAIDLGQPPIVIKVPEHE